MLQFLRNFSIVAALAAAPSAFAAHGQLGPHGATGFGKGVGPVVFARGTISVGGGK